MKTSFNLDKIVREARSSYLTKESQRKECYSKSLGTSTTSTELFTQEETVLKSEAGQNHLCLWAQCFLRWIVPAQIEGGGNPSQYVQQCVLAEEVACLNHQLQQLTHSASGRPTERPLSHLLFGATGYSSNSKHLSSLYINSSFPFTQANSQPTLQSYVCGPLSKYLKETNIDHDSTVLRN